MISVSVALALALSIGPGAPTLVLHWKKQLGGYVRSPPAALGSGHVIVGTSGGSVYCIKLSDGTIRWRAAVPRGVGGIGADPSVSLAVDDGVFFGARNGVVGCLSPLTGRMRWSYSTAGAVGRPCILMDEGVAFGSADASVYALDRKTGERKWEVRTESAIVAPPVCFVGRLFVGTQGGTLLILDPNDGKQIARADLRLEVRSLQVLTQRELVLAASELGELVAWDARRLQERWRTFVGKYLWTDPFVAVDSILTIRSDGELSILSSRNGKLERSVLLGGGSTPSSTFRAGPAQVGPSLFVGAAGARGLVLFQMDPIRVLQRVAGETSVSSPVALVSGNRVVFGTGDGFLRCYRIR